MPREVYFASPVSVDLPSLALAGAEVDDSLGLLALSNGAAIQLVDGADVAVLTIDNSRLLSPASDLERLVPSLAGGSDQVWWTTATVPWGPAGDAGIRVAEALARRLGGRLRIEDGT